IETNISEIIKNTEMFYLEQIQQKGIKYTYFPPKQDILIKCLNVQLSQALLNLVNNAIHAIEDSPSPWIIVQIEVSEEALELSVINSGDKIPPKIAAHLFDPFYTTKDPDKGTGLGLSITKSIIEKHNGIIEYDDSGDNTRFNIYLPTETG
ncbi:MAG: HAMP domain-containing histidine kinase, partial [Bdellovibrionales bacterium]|nr:HAMP domain-containing histidine kinase [Bdellovibrionales bacterium]